MAAKQDFRWAMSGMEAQFTNPHYHELRDGSQELTICGKMVDPETWHRTKARPQGVYCATCKAGSHG